MEGEGVYLVCIYEWLVWLVREGGGNGVMIGVEDRG